MPEEMEETQPFVPRLSNFHPRHFLLALVRIET